MVIKSSETKSDQPFLELYKKLSKEVVAGGEKLLKEIQANFRNFGQNFRYFDNQQHSKLFSREFSS